MATNQTEVVLKNVFLKGFFLRLGYGLFAIPFIMFEDYLNTHTNSYAIGCQVFTLFIYLIMCVVGGINDMNLAKEEQNKLSEKDLFSMEERIFITGQRKYIGGGYQKWLGVCLIVWTVGWVLKMPEISSWTRLDTFNFALMIGIYVMWFSGYNTNKKWIRIVDKLMK